MWPEVECPDVCVHLVQRVISKYAGAAGEAEHLRIELYGGIGHFGPRAVMRRRSSAAGEGSLPECALTQVEARNKELQKLGVGVKIVCVGKKGSSYFKRRLDRFTVSGAAPMCHWGGARPGRGWGARRATSISLCQSLPETDCGRHLATGVRDPAKTVCVS